MTEVNTMIEGLLRNRAIMILVGGIAAILAACSGRTDSVVPGRPPPASLTSAGESPAVEPVVPIIPPIDAFISEVLPDRKLVILSEGSYMNVQVGYEFSIYRGATFIGKVKVVKVYDDLAGARIISIAEGESVQVGDKAATGI